MSTIEKLIHNPLRLFQLLSSKYSDITEEFECLYLDCILYSKPSHYLSIFKELVYLDHTEEYLKRFYHFGESTERIPYLADYYKNYHLFFCQPVFSNWKLTALIHNRCDTKAELFYKNNYGNINEKQSAKKEKKENGSHYDINNDSLSSFDNATSNKTIFDAKIRKRIDNNIATTMNFDNGEGDMSSCIQGSKLYTKRSSNDSLRIIVTSLNVMTHQNGSNNKTQHQMKHNKKNSNGNGNNKNGLSLKSSLCTLIRTKMNPSTNSNLNEYNKLLLSPKLRPFISNYHSNFVEFNKGKQEKILTSSSNNNNLNQKFSVVIPNLSQQQQQQLVIKNKKSNKTYDSKSLAKTKCKKYVFGGLNQDYPNQNESKSNNTHCLLSNHSKSKSQKNSITNHHQRNQHSNSNSKGIPNNCTYTNFILNAKSKRMNFVQSQRSCSSKNGQFTSNTIKINSSNMCKNYCLSNSNIFTNSNNKNNNSNSTNANHNNPNHPHHPNSLKKNSMQFHQTHYTDNISRNKKNDNRITTVRTKNSLNFQGLTTFKASSSIEDKKIHCLELKTIIKELSKNNNEHQTLRFGAKLNELLKTSHTVNWVKKQTQRDKDKYKVSHINSNSNNMNDMHQQTNNASNSNNNNNNNASNSHKIMYPNKPNPSGESRFSHQMVAKATSQNQKKKKLHSPLMFNS